jgi:hypothetical protein
MIGDITTLREFIKDEDIPEKDLMRLYKLLLVIEENETEIDYEPDIELLLVIPEYEYDDYWHLFGVGMIAVESRVSVFVDHSKVMEEERAKFVEFTTSEEHPSTYYLMNITP